MSATATMERITETSPAFKARMAGVFQFFEGLTSTSGQVMILGKLVVAGSIAATAANVLSHERLYWFGFASSIVGVVCHIAWAFLMYELLRPVNKSVSSLAAFVILVGCGIQALAGFLYVAPLLILQGGSSLSAFTTQQLQALAAMFLKLNSYAFDTYLAFFGFWCILIGYLIFKSTFLPRILGVLLTISGLGWAIFLVPPVAHRLFPVIAAASALGELPLELWLIVMGVNAHRWKEQASAAAHIVF